ncbi:MAG: SLAC1 anion channel family protein [Sulfurovum sp.]
MNKEEIKNIPYNRLQFFPIMMFAIVMGLAGLTLVFQKISHVFYLPFFVSTIMIVITFAVYLFVLYTYIKKILKYRDEVLKEFAHPIRINFFAAFSISTLLISMIIYPYINEVGNILFIFGAVFHIFFTFYTIKYWIDNNLEMQHSNPAWFISIVGNLIVPIASNGYFNDSVLYFYFAIGIFFWIVLFSIILNRIIFHQQFAPKFLPTLFILIAPPAVGFLSYVELVGKLDFFAHMLYSLALFFTILVFFMYKKFMNIKFFISWWAFTFPSAAMTIATIKMYVLTEYWLYGLFAYIFMIACTVIVYFVAKQTLIHISKKEICIME